MKRVLLLKSVASAFVLLAVTACPNPSSPAPPAKYVLEVYGNTYLLRGIAFGNGIFVAVGDGPTIITSTDGVNWTLQTPPATYSGGLSAIVYAGGTFVAVGAGIISSSDGVNWTQASSVPVGTYSAVAYGGGTYVAVGGSAVAVATSPTGTWAAAMPNPPSDTLSSVAYGNGTFTAVGTQAAGSGPAVWTSSSPGTTWTSTGAPALSAFPSSFNSITFGNGMFVTVGGGGQIGTSTAPATSWSAQTSGVTDNLMGVVYGNGGFVTATDNNLDQVILLSSDSVNWTSKAITTPVNVSLVGVAFGNNTYVVIGDPLLG